MILNRCFSICMLISLLFVSFNANAFPEAQASPKSAKQLELEQKRKEHWQRIQQKNLQVMPKANELPLAIKRDIAVRTKRSQAEVEATTMTFDKVKKRIEESDFAVMLILILASALLLVKLIKSWKKHARHGIPWHRP